MQFRVALHIGKAAKTTWWWVIRSAGNGAVLATSEVYGRRRDAERTARAVAEALGVELEVPDA
jgi:uncharacterized protein YegP (UPF0339 family)